MKRFLPLLLILVSTLSFAQTAKVMIQKPVAQVYTNPSTTSEVLVVLKKGSKVDVLGVTQDGVWAKVKVVVSGFQFDGWIQRSAIAKAKTETVAKPAAKSTTPPKTAAPASGLKSSSTTELEKFFEPSTTTSTPAPTTNVAPTESPRESEPAAAPKPKKQKTPREPGEKSWVTDRLTVYGLPGFSFLQYTFSDATEDAFRYNLSGLNLQTGAEYQAFQLFNDALRISGQLNAQYAFFNTKTNLLDGTGTEFSDLTAKNRMLDIWIKLKLMLNFDVLMQKPFLIGLSVGYDYMKFFGDDIIDDTDVPVGLFVNQTTTSIPVGLIAELHFLDPVTLIMGTDVLMMSSSSESPDGSSGSDANPGLGLTPYLHLTFPLVGDKHYMGFMYQFRIQETKFTGPSSVRVNNTLNDASALQTMHTLSLEYAYHF